MSSSQNSMAASVLRPASTDDDGRFQLSGLPQGAYTIMVVMPGYVTAPDPAGKRYVRPGDTANITMVRGGVITGKVTGSQGEPVVGTRIQAIRIRDIENRPLKPAFSATSFLSLAVSNLEWKTDDRGIYRIYGLEPGIYHVAAGGRGPMPNAAAPYDKDAPTYHPSGTADTAADVTVRAGEEATGIDIRYRAMEGHAISGSVDGPPGFLRGGISVMLARKSSGTLAATTFVLPGAQSKGYIFDGVGDGDYYVTAYASSMGQETEIASSRPRAVAVKGSDVTGANLTLAPLGVITGHIVIEPAQGAGLKEKCKEQATARLDEIVIRARAAGSSKSEGVTFSLIETFLSSAPGEKGEFTIRYTDAGRHHIDIDLPASPWYVRAITLPGPPAAARQDVAGNGINLKTGGRIEGLVVTLAEGAAGLTGRVVPAKEGVALPSRLRVHLVPAEKEAAEKTLRYAETVTGGDGAYAFRNLEPGRYWMVVRAIPDEESPEENRQPLAWDASARAGLRFEGEAINSAVELKHCQQLGDFTVRYTPPLTRPAKRSGQR
jgi:hypothetical protein